MGIFWLCETKHVNTCRTTDGNLQRLGSTEIKNSVTDLQLKTKQKPYTHSHILTCLGAIAIDCEGECKFLNDKYIYIYFK